MPLLGGAEAVQDHRPGLQHKARRVNARTTRECSRSEGYSSWRSGDGRRALTWRCCSFCAWGWAECALYTGGIEHQLGRVDTALGSAALQIVGARCVAPKIGRDGLGFDEKGGGWTHPSLSLAKPLPPCTSPAEPNATRGGSSPDPVVSSSGGPRCFLAHSK